MTKINCWLFCGAINMDYTSDFDSDGYREMDVLGYKGV
jgi:hypothetical protein